MPETAIDEHGHVPFGECDVYRSPRQPRYGIVNSESVPKTMQVAPQLCLRTCIAAALSAHPVADATGRRLGPRILRHASRLGGSCPGFMPAPTADPAGAPPSA